MRYNSTTGLDEPDISELAARIHQVLQGRGIHSGRYRLGLDEQVAVVLVLLRQNLPQTVVADMFGISQPTVSRIYRRILPLLDHVLAFTGIPLEQAVQRHRLVLVDGTYVPTRNRPALGRDLERANYSGKHRLQCLAVQVAATTGGQLITVSDPVPGARHDSTALEHTAWAQILNHEHVSWIADTAYLKHTALTPIRRTPGRPLLDWEKEHNRTLARLRAPVEHAIAHLKQWKILSTGYRGPLPHLPDTIATVTRLELYRLGW